MGAPASVRERLARRLGRAPGRLRLGLAGAAVVLGIVLLTRPTTSLGVLAVLIGAGLVLHGAVDAVTRVRDAGGLRAVEVLVAALWVVAGAVVLVLPGLTVRLLAVVVGGGLVLDGVVRLAAAARRGVTGDARLATAAFGVAGVVLGALALLWPDITLLVVAVTFGARLVMAGLALARTVRRSSRRPRATPPGPLRRWSRTVAALVSVLLAVGAALLSAAVREGSPVVDDFYAAPRTVPGEPGQLVRAEPFTREVPPTGRAWRILYTTSRSDGSPAVASGIVVVPAAGPGDWPVVDWNHGTTGIARSCAPSLAEEPFASGALMILPEVLAEGWALVATDYIGLGGQGPHPYLVGPDSAHASLDAVRAAHQLTAADLGERTVVWGHSQGGGAALWTGALAEVYAPELSIDGVAALAPAADLTALVSHLPDVTGGSVFAAYVAAAYAAEYEDITFREHVRPGAEVTVRQMAERCLAAPGVLGSALDALALAGDPQVLAGDPTTGAFGARLAQNEPPAAGSAPLLVGQGAADDLITPQAQDGYVARLCEAGRVVDYRSYEGRDHLSLVAPDSPLVPELLEWTRERFGGAPGPAGCSTR